MDAELKTKWVAALRSGDYKQGTGSMRPAGGRYCCLGILRDVCGVENIWSLKLPTGLLIGMNDGDGMRKHSFPEIADYIEKNL